MKKVSKKKAPTKGQLSLNFRRVKPQYVSFSVPAQGVMINLRHDGNGGKTIGTLHVLPDGMIFYPPNKKTMHGLSKLLWSGINQVANWLAAKPKV